MNLRSRYGRYVPTLSNASMVYLYAAAFVLFSLWIPHLWLSAATFRGLLNISFAIPTLVALGLLLPLSAGVFDLSIAGSMELSSVLVATLMVEKHWSIAPAVIIALAASTLVGLVNGMLVHVVGINSFVATLGTGAVATSVSVMVSNNRQIADLPARFISIGSGIFGWGLEVQVLFAAVLAVLVWFFLEHTTAGKYTQAVGENPDAARLAGLRVGRYVIGSLCVSGLLSGFAGLVITANIGTADSTIGDPYLLTAFATCFLGAAQFRRRFNVPGVLVAGWTLNSGVEGITLALNSYPWLNQFFFGIALIVAVGLTSGMDRLRGLRWVVMRTAARTSPDGHAAVAREVDESAPESAPSEPAR